MKPVEANRRTTLCGDLRPSARQAGTPHPAPSIINITTPTPSGTTGDAHLLTNDTTTTTPAGQYNYEAYGVTTYHTGASTNLGYAGQYTDTETGFQYLRARYYDPTVGEFISRDPAGLLTRSPYGYTYNDPLNHIDLNGLWPWDDAADAAKDAWDATGGKVVHGVKEATVATVDFVGNHKVGILKTGAFVLAVAAIPTSGGTSLLLAGGALGLDITAQALDGSPCKAERITQAAGIGLVTMSVGVLWTSAAEAADMAADVGSKAVATGAGKGFAAGSLLSFSAPTPTCEIQQVGAKC